MNKLPSNVMYTNKIIHIIFNDYLIGWNHTIISEHSKYSTIRSAFSIRKNI